MEGQIGCDSCYDIIIDRVLDTVEHLVRILFLILFFCNSYNFHHFNNKLDVQSPKDDPAGMGGS